MKYFLSNFIIEDILNDLGIKITNQRGEWIDIPCPLHPERKPSFSLNLSTGGWVCRHNGDSGSLKKLIYLIKGISYSDINKYISQKERGLNISTMDSLLSILAPSERAVNAAVEHSCEPPADWIERYNNLPERKTVKYFLNRGFTTDTALAFGVRYDPEWRRLIWPVKDQKEKITGFITRAIDKNVEKRYLYSPGFQKIFYPLDKVDTNILGTSKVILVEGGLDAMWMHQIGYICTLGMLGSSLKEEQVEWLIENVQSIIIIPDHDAAGEMAKQKTIKDLSGFLNIEITEIPDNLGCKDVNDMTELEIHNLIGNRKSVYFG